jgi:hypothetical protein
LRRQQAERIVEPTEGFVEIDHDTRTASRTSGCFGSMIAFIRSPKRCLPPRDCFEGSIGKTPRIAVSDIGSSNFPTSRFPRKFLKYNVI